MDRVEDLQDEGSSSSPTKRQRTNTSDFSNGTKAKVKAETRELCWHCDAASIDVCHVIGSRDNSVSSHLKLRGWHLMVL
jgi:hypothetical protein